MSPLRDRISELYRCIPNSYPLASTIFDLKETLDTHGIISDVDDVALHWEDYRRLLRPQKLYHKVLSHIIHSCTMDVNRSVDLSVYLGDVLCFAFLILNPYIRVKKRPSPQKNPYQSFYEEWVRLHSRILRSTDFTVVESNRLGLSTHGILPKLPFPVMSRRLQSINEGVFDLPPTSEMTQVFFQIWTPRSGISWSG